MEGQTVSLIKQQHRYLRFMDDFIPLIRNTGLFPRFTSKQFDSLLGGSTIDVFQKGQYVFKQGDMGHKFYVILSGFVEVIRTRRSPLFMKKETSLAN
jgi:signal-transduction protein with cAMP-binding, CBS, and nucleotidyltransferase domain